MIGESQPDETAIRDALADYEELLLDRYGDILPCDWQNREPMPSVIDILSRGGTAEDAFLMIHGD